MGLDMYLEKKIYIGGQWDHRNVTGKVEITIGNEKKTIEVNPRDISELVLSVGSWRKANQIHNWFVQNVQNGVDECKEHYVSREQLADLKGLCEKVLADKSLAPELLPTQSGFFFGSTEYGDYYFEDLKYTIAILDKALSDDEGDFYYRSSW